ncbi:hypothetical protein [Variovorax ginsengisoli]|uniref:Uncharacterized protein n=1 Tax=Variovorax ginsengisoli TaxID=363844 RepID=A0ABT9SEW3_9BURK|nr:hypothetical protein [Variovorax ginsengisoli]MDP9902906.1 hypothetical protein [Variovorax ginsengisoli]
MSSRTPYRPALDRLPRVPGSATPSLRLQDVLLVLLCVLLSAWLAHYGAHSAQRPLAKALTDRYFEIDGQTLRDSLWRAQDGQTQFGVLRNASRWHVVTPLPLDSAPASGMQPMRAGAPQPAHLTRVEQALEFANGTGSIVSADLPAIVAAMRESAACDCTIARPRIGLSVSPVARLGDYTPATTMSLSRALMAMSAWLGTALLVALAIAMVLTVVLHARSNQRGADVFMFWAVIGVSALGPLSMLLDWASFEAMGHAFLR